MYWAVAEGERRGWVVVSARTKAGLTNGGGVVRILRKGPDDPQIKAVPTELFALAQQKAGQIHEEYLDI